MSAMIRSILRIAVPILIAGALFIATLAPALAAITSLTGDLQQPSNANGNRFVDVTTDGSGTFHGIWRPRSEDPIFVGSFDAGTGTWTQVSFTPSDVSAQVTGTLSNFSDDVGIAVDGNGHIHVVFRSEIGSGTNSERGVFYGEYNGSTWDFDKVFTAKDPSGWKNTNDPRIDVTSAGVPSITFEFDYVRPDPREHYIKYTTRTAANTWSTPIDVDTSLSTSQEVFNGDFVLDSSGKAHVTYIKEFGDGYNGNLFYATNSSGSFVHTQITNLSGNNPSDPAIYSNSIALDSGGKVHIAYQQGTYDNATLYYTNNSGGSFGSPTTIDTSGEAGSLNSLSISGSNKSIVHKNGDNLRVSYQLGSAAWVTETVPKGSGSMADFNGALRGAMNSSGYFMALFHRNVVSDSNERASFVYGSLTGANVNVAPKVNTPTVTPSPSNEGQSVTAKATFSDANAADTHTCTVNYGDGSSTQAGSVSGTTCTGPSHTYTDSGSYTVTVTVTDNSSASGNNTVSHPVNNVAPTVNTPVVTPSPSNEGQSVTASATFSDPGASDTHTCTVNYGDGSGSQAGTVAGTTCTGPSHTYTDNGSYTVTVAVTDNDSGTGNKTASHTVNNVAPTVNAPTVNPTPSDEGESVVAEATFSDPGTDDTHTCTVDYGDGSGAQAGTVSGTTCTGPGHAYADNGSYTVTVAVTDGDSGTHSNSVGHTVNNVPPTVNTPSVTPAPSDEGESVVAEATFSDPGTGDTHTCTVDYGDGSGAQAGSVSGITCTGPSHIYTDNGSYTVTVVVTDDDTGADTESVSHTVNNLDPVIGSVTNDGPIDEGSSATITVTASDPAGVNDPLLYEFDCDNDGTYEVGPQAGNTMTCSYGDDGAFDVPVRVTDDDGGSATSSTTVTVDNVPPSVESVANDGPVDEGSPITLTVTATDPAGTNDPLIYDFDCDNNGVFETGGVGNQGSCIFSDNGSFTVGVQVMDDDGGSVVSSTTVAITNVAPTVNIPSVDIGPSQEGQSVVASATFSDPGAADTHTCTVDYGDGTGPQDGTVDGTTCTGPAHIYLDDDPSGTASDPYTVTVTVTDDDLGSNANSIVQTVNNVAPTISGIPTNSPVPQGQPVTITVTASDVGVNDTLTYSFDCDNDGSYETPGVGNQGECTLDPSAATSTIGVQVEDDDLGVTIDTVVVGQTIDLCLDYWSGGVTPATGAGCGAGELLQTVPGPISTTFCINPYTGALSWSSQGACADNYQPHVIPDDGPLYYCQSLWTGKLRHSGNGQCSAYEVPGVIPG